MREFEIHISFQKDLFGLKCILKLERTGFLKNSVAI